MGKQRCDGTAVTPCGYVQNFFIMMFMLYLNYQCNDVIVKVSATASSGITDWISIGPIQLVPPSSERKSFCWTACVDKKRGIAFSRETSNVANDKSSKILNRQDRSLNEMMIHSFEVYPIWMCQGSVSLGLLKAIPQTKRVGCSYKILTRLGGINLLTFDRPLKKRKYIFNKLSSIESYDTVTIPLLGGLMTNGKGKETQQGSLKFSLHTTVVNRHGEPYPQQRRRFIITEIDNYRPMLLGAGGGLRARVYLHTQSVIHAYVMWRFHNHILHNVKQYCR